MAGTENVGRAGVASLDSTQHRGTPQYTPEEMRKRHPLIQVAAEGVEKRRAKPHEFRSTSYSTKICDLDDFPLEHPIHYF